MKYIVEVMAVYEIDAPDMRDAQRQGYLKGMGIVDNDVECTAAMVYSVNTENGYHKNGAIK